jgi:predicted dienelactone hydrolase
MPGLYPLVVTLKLVCYLTHMKRIVLYRLVPLLSAIALCAVWIRLSVFVPGTLPPPRGPHAVGRAEFDWLDESRPDPFVPSQKRELDALVWYPAERAGGMPAVYVRENWLRQLDRPFPLPKLNRVKTHSWDSVPIATPGRGKWPVVILSSGFGALPSDYTCIAEELASRGYVVAAPANTYSGLIVVFPDGHVAKEVETLPSDDRLAEIWADDIKTVVKQLAKLDKSPASLFYQKLELARLGVIGHSFGGVASAQYCIAESNCAAGIDMDGALWGDAPKRGIQSPFLFLISDGTTAFWSSRNKKQDWARQYHEFLATYQVTCAIFPRCAVEIQPGFRHMNFTDSAALFQPPLVWVHPLLGSIERYDGLDTTRRKITEFLDGWMKHIGS